MSENPTICKAYGNSLILSRVLRPIYPGYGNVQDKGWYKIFVIPGGRLCGYRLHQGCDSWVGGKGDGVVQEDGQEVGKAGTKHNRKLFKVWPPWWLLDPRICYVEWFGE